MDPSKTGLFDLAEKRLTWAAQRQAVLATNIANANTPGYQAKDVTPFAQVLAGTGALAPTQTRPNHLSGCCPAASLPCRGSRPRCGRWTAMRSPWTSS